jgi:hypothetical protein
MTKFKVSHLLLIILFSTISCRQMWGDNDLGDNFSLLEGDRIEDRIIVYCSGRSAGACMAGTPIVPIYSRQFDNNGHYAEYVEIAKANDKFIIAQTLQIKNNKENYWIIFKGFKIENCDKANCDSIVQSHVVGPMEYSQFQSKLSELNIDLKFDKN